MAKKKYPEDGISHPTIGEAAAAIVPLWLSKEETVAFIARLCDAPDGPARQKVVAEAKKYVAICSKILATHYELASETLARPPQDQGKSMMEG